MVFAELFKVIPRWVQEKVLFCPLEGWFLKPVPIWRSTRRFRCGPSLNGEQGTKDMLLFLPIHELAPIRSAEGRGESTVTKLSGMVRQALYPRAGICLETQSPCQWRDRRRNCRSCGEQRFLCALHPSSADLRPGFLIDAKKKAKKPHLCLFISTCI